MSLFGEIVEPGSRVAWEDWDEVYNEESLNFELSWKNKTSVPEVVDTLYILEGKYLSDCLNIETMNLQLIDSVPEVNLHVYKVDVSNNFLCIIKDYNLMMTSEIVELLREYLKVSHDVVTIQTKPISDYQTTMTIHDCIVRAVSTNAEGPYCHNFGFPKLEQPNIISGVSAGVISLREHLNSSGTALVCYVEELENDSGVNHLLKKFNIFKNVTTKPSSILNSNLYM